MNIKELKAAIKELESIKELDDTLEVIIEGEFNRGNTTTNAYLARRGSITDDGVKDGVKDVFVIKVPNYLYMADDIGNESMYVDEKEYNEFEEDDFDYDFD